MNFGHYQHRFGVSRARTLYFVVQLRVELLLELRHAHDDQT